jgi:uncharacterized membrane protein YeaQ/YmgE (transglycosylase-associated protein family)
MISYKARLRALFVLVLPLAVAALFYKAEPAGAPPPPPPTDIGAALTGVYVSTAVWGDYDSDGDLDILLTGSDGAVPVSKVYRNDGAGVFTDIGAGLVQVGYSAAAWGDYDSDGDLDILLTGTDGLSNFSKVYRNNGGDAFTDIGAVLTGVNFGSVAWGDYDSDGDLDILLTGLGDTAVVTTIYRNDGEGAFTDIGAGLIGIALGAAVWGDYDSDGDLDVALSGISTSGEVSKIYRNDGGAFTDIGAPLTGTQLGSIAWGDYDSDGDLDLLLSGYDGTNPIARIYRNDGGATFNAIGAGLTGVYLSSGAWGDYDNDGDLDILLNGTDGTNRLSTIYSNDGGGVFTDAGAGMTGTALGSVAWGDYDSDGDLDALLTGSVGPTAASIVYRNNSTVANAVPEAPTKLVAKRDALGRLILSWKASSDSTTPNTALSYNLRLKKSGKQIFSEMAASDGYRRVVRMGNVGESKKIKLSDLAKGTYRWSVQAIDSAYAGSAFSAVKKVKLPGVISIKLSRKKVCRYGKPRFIVYKGRITPAPTPRVKVTLQRRPSKHAHWKKMKKVKTKSSGAFVFKKVGKTFRRSFWLRTVVKLPDGVKLKSKPKLLRVRPC